MKRLMLERWQNSLSKLFLVKNNDALDRLIQTALQPDRPKRLAFLNAHGFNMLLENEEFYSNILACDIVLRDGIGTAMLLHWLRAEAGLNCNGTDLIPKLIAAYDGACLAFYGTSADIVKSAAASAKMKPHQHIIAVDGFQPQHIYADSIKEHKPGLIILAMGMPRQEQLAAQLAAVVDYPALIVCGGAILDFLGGKVSRAPSLLRKTGLEWLFRLMLEPRRLFRRYVIGNPLFLLRARRFSRMKRGQLTFAGQQLLQSPPAHEDERMKQNAIAIAAAEGPKNAVASAYKSVPGFQPSVPVILPAALHGRSAELMRMEAAIFEQASHILLFGHRGYGKTSLARVFGDRADAAGSLVVYLSCSRHIGFQDLMRQLVGELALFHHDKVDASTLIESWRTSFPDGYEIAEQLTILAKTRTILILDEYDRIEQMSTRDQIVQLMKDLSDISAKLHLVLVGVASDAVHLLGHHPSIHRCVLCLPIRRLSDANIQQLIKATMLELGVRMTQEFKDGIIYVCGGSSYHAQLIGHMAVSLVRSSGKKQANAEHLRLALQEIVDDAKSIDPSLRLLLSLFHGSDAIGLLALASRALDHRDDQMILGTEENETDLARITEMLCTMSLIEPVESGVPGRRVYSFCNAFAPQLVRMAEYLVEHEIRNPR